MFMLPKWDNNRLLSTFPPLGFSFNYAKPFGFFISFLIISVNCWYNLVFFCSYKFSSFLCYFHYSSSSIQVLLFLPSSFNRIHHHRLFIFVVNFMSFFFHNFFLLIILIPFILFAFFFFSHGFLLIQL